jgi:hypothetical protein
MTDIIAGRVNATTVEAQSISASQFGGAGGAGATITVAKIILGGWMLEGAADGIYVTTPTGIRTKMELIDFRQTPVPPTATLNLPATTSPAASTALPGGPAGPGGPQ